LANASEPGTRNCTVAIGRRATGAAPASTVTVRPAAARRSAIATPAPQLAATSASVNAPGSHAVAVAAAPPN
jgi:hypothetical protein